MLSVVDATLTRKFINFLMIDGKKNVAYRVFCLAGHQFLRSLDKNHKEGSTATPLEKTALGLTMLADKEQHWQGSQVTSGAFLSVKPPASVHKFSSSELKKGLLPGIDGGGSYKPPSAKMGKRVVGKAPPLGLLLVKLGIAVENVKPSLECRRCRIAGTSRLIPSIVPESRGLTLAVRWIVEAARERKKNNKIPLFQCLAQELSDAYEKQGRPRQRRDQYHKLAEGNRGYLRYRWW